jgi:predicted enzyme related to lactoylglutathione lyase
MTNDPKEAEAFYNLLMGWGAEPWAGSDPPYTMWTSGGVPLGGVMELGGRVVYGPMEVPGGDRIAQCLDPQGALFALHEVAGR